MAAFFRRGPGLFTALLGLAFWGLAAVVGRADVVPQLSRSAQTESSVSRPVDFAQMVRDQAETDEIWEAASTGVMRMDKISYRSSVGDLDVPAFVFEPLELHGLETHPAIVWVHENIRGHLYEHYIPYIR